MKKNIKHPTDLQRKALDFLSRNSDGIFSKDFVKLWLYGGGTETYFDFTGRGKLPDITNDDDKLNMLVNIFLDIYLIPCLFSDNYEKRLVNKLDRLSYGFWYEGPYGYKDGFFDVTIKANDIVIDAGAWIGDFSAYASSKKATVYAFEPIESLFQLLSKTALMNGGIYPVQKGLGSNKCELLINMSEINSGSNTIVASRQDDASTKEKIMITDIDTFVEENNIPRIDFIKADIEGAERDMLRGASRTLKQFSPKLAICTYHLPDDPEVLENIILQSNQKYKVIHLRRKLFACVYDK